MGELKVSSAQARSAAEAVAMRYFGSVYYDSIARAVVADGLNRRVKIFLRPGSAASGSDSTRTFFTVYGERVATWRSHPTDERGYTDETKYRVHARWERIERNVHDVDWRRMEKIARDLRKVR
jgi:hypothetical protein